MKIGFKIILSTFLGIVIFYALILLVAGFLGVNLGLIHSTTQKFTGCYLPVDNAGACYINGHEVYYKTWYGYIALWFLLYVFFTLLIVSIVKLLSNLFQKDVIVKSKKFKRWAITFFVCFTVLSFGIAFDLAVYQPYFNKGTNIADASTSPQVKEVSRSNASITLTSPVGGEQWVQGSTHDITWTSSGLDNNDRVYIEAQLATPDNNGHYIVTTKVLVDYPARYPAATGSYAWTIPSDTSLTNQAKIMIIDYNTDSSIETMYDISKNFSIIGN